MQPKVRATAVLIEDGTILLVEQKVSTSVQRAWSLPGGTLEFGETLEACRIREVCEETGLHVAIERLLYICDRIADGRHVVHITFAVKRTGGRLHTGIEPEPDANPIRSVRMVPLNTLADYGFSERFVTLAMQGFPNAGTYKRSVENIGL
ncbi:MAG: NUDIX hydrolase [Anaerolineae bacterium]|nr:NUDIX hydrolase [Anaerolineae bacterium]